MMKIIQIRIITLLSSIVLFSLSYADVDLQEPELVGSALDGDIIATFEGFGRNESGLFERIPITVKNVSEATSYELLLDPRIHQIAIQLWDGDAALNDPFENVPQRRMGDVRLNLLRLDPGQAHLIDVDVNEFIESNIYEHLEEINIFFSLTVPIYNEDADTTHDSSLGILQVSMSPKFVRVVKNEGQN